MLFIITFYLFASIVSRWIGITQFSPTYARQAFPCMDEPHLKATFTITIGHFTNQTATSNTDIKKIEEVLVYIII